MDRIWQWAWDRRGTRYSWLVYAVAMLLSLPPFLFWSFLIVAVAALTSDFRHVVERVRAHGRVRVRCRRCDVGGGVVPEQCATNCLPRDRMSVHARFRSALHRGLSLAPSLQPIRDLAKGTERVAAGDSSRRLPVFQDDDRRRRSTACRRVWLSGNGFRRHLVPTSTRVWRHVCSSRATTCSVASAVR